MPAHPVRYQLHAKTKLMLLENVCTGSIHRLTAEELSAGGCEIKTIYASTDDSGYGGIRRYRGWSLDVMGMRLLLHVLRN